MWIQFRIIIWSLKLLEQQKLSKPYCLNQKAIISLLSFAWQLWFFFYWILIGYLIKLCVQMFQPLRSSTEVVILFIIIGDVHHLNDHCLIPLDPLYGCINMRKRWHTMQNAEHLIEVGLWKKKIFSRSTIFLIALYFLCFWEI